MPLLIASMLDSVLIGDPLFQLAIAIPLFEDTMHDSINEWSAPKEDAGCIPVLANAMELSGIPPLANCDLPRCKPFFHVSMTQTAWQVLS